MSRLHSVQRVVGGFLAFVFAVSTMLPAVAQEVPPSPGNSAEWPARLWGQPQLTYDTGYTAFMQDIAKLRTTARLMATAAHPDDEDGGMLAMESRGLGATALELTLTRGEGGQNKTGQELFDELGILRTLELLQADQFYGVEERFSRAVDFGFSKNAQETFDKWGGHDIPLADMVRVIRTFRPDVIVSVFSGTSNDGHGNHQASGMLTREAFRAAADPNRFPDQLKDGLSPWQPKKLYVGRFVGGENCQVTLNAGAYNPLLGTSYAELGTEGRGHQISQVSSPLVLPGNRSRCYNLVDSAFPGGTKPAATESGLFDGIDTSLPGIAARLGGEENKVPFLAAVLDKLDAAAKNAAGFGPRDMSMAAPILLGGVKILREIIPQVRQSSLSAAAKGELLTHLDTKLAQFEKAAADASALDLIAAVDPASNGQQGGFFRMEQTFLVAVPGQTFTMTAQLFNRGQQPIENVKLDLETPPGWKVEALDAPATKPIAYNTSATARFRVTVPPDAQYTRPYFYRDDPQTESVYRVLPQLSQFVTLPFPPPPVIAHAQYSIGDAAGEVRSVPQVRYIDPIYGQAERPLSVGPPMSVELQPETRIYSIEKDGSTQVRVGVRNNVVGGAQGGLRVQAPQGWRVQPESQPVKFTQNGEYASFEFAVTPPAGRAGAASALREQKYTITAVLDFNGKQYSDGYNVVARRDIGTFYYYRPARQVMSAVDVKLPPRLRVGYIMGAGDDIPPALQQLGMDVHLLSPEELAGGDLSRYATIVLGIRAYDVRTDVREENRRLLDFVQRGGTLLVQYNQGTGLFNAGHYTPYPATVSGERITVEEAPVEVLAPADPVFNAPNKITAKDFDGWVQERGLYFMSNWAPEYRALLSSHDPGEQPLKGGLLVATYGKGTYIFTGYAFFRQVPAGVPGAIRLFVNLLSVGANARP